MIDITYWPWVAVQDGDGWKVNHPGGFRVQGIGGGIKADDARLIAAAPELLHFAMKLISVERGYGCGFYSEQEYIDAVKGLMLAVEKATGAEYGE